MNRSMTLRNSHRPESIANGRATAVVLAFALQAATMFAAEPANTAGLELFERRVRPLLVENCHKCHGPEKQESSLRLDRRDWVLQGGNTGPAVTPGKPDESLLIEAVRYESFEMPPHGKLPDDDISALERWVRLGAPWPKEADPSGPALGDQTAIREVAETHWAFQPVAKVDPPKVSRAEWVQTPVDNFVLAKLEAAGLAPSSPADRRTLLRRVSIDLVGLPPSPEDVETFVNDSSSDAYRHAVERLLDSPQYGERWARHWLDIARYADTREWQAQIDSRYPYAYTYRDYVINAFNSDLPYDEFIRQQLAADLYSDDPHSPTLAALGFLTVGPRYRNSTDDMIADRIDVVTRGLQGLTVGCARCHDHKYDPIPIEDYYSLYGVFGSIEDPEQLPLIDAAGPSPDLVADYERQRAEKVNDLTTYQKQLQDAAHAHLRERYVEYFAAYYEMNVTRKESVRSLITGGKLSENALTPLGDTLDRIKTQAKWKRDPVFAPWAALIGVPDDEFDAQLDEFLKGAEEGLRPGTVNPLVLKELSTNRPTSRKGLLELYGRVFQQAENAGEQAADPAVAKIREMLHSEEGPFHFTTEAVTQASRLLGGGRAALGKLTTAIQEVDSTHPGAPPRAMAVAEKEQPLTPTVFLRGDPRRRGDTVPRRYLAIIEGEDRPAFEQGSGRRELAEAITDPSNPLTARVIVDQVWMHHFGTGFVSTPGDFGLRSDPPSHPELLDWLAATFMEEGWSLKSLHRLIVLSSTYQQSSAYAPVPGAKVDPRSVDPDNRLLWRANRRRLDFEAMRDAMLCASGRIDLTLGGRSRPSRSHRDARSTVTSTE
jgi:mono/diheme cytochrome c family protein